MSLTPGNARALVYDFEHNRPGILKDDTVTGLALYAYKSGKKAFHYYYRTKTRIERRPKLGLWPDMTIDGARRAARDIMEQVAAGRDPGAELQERRRAPTMAVLCDRYAERWADKNKAGSSAKADRSYIERYIKPKLGTMKVDDVKSSHIEDLLDDVLHVRFGTSKNHSHRTSAPIAANRTRALLSKIFNLAMTDAYEMRSKALGNPVTKDVARNPERKRKRIATGAELFEVAKALEHFKPIYPRQVAALLTILFTGARKNEINGVDLRQRQGGVLVLDDHKTVDTIGEKRIYLPAEVAATLDSMTPGKDGRVFGRHNLNYVWNQVREMAECPDLTIHDARRTWISIALTVRNYSLTATGKHVGHANAETTNGYAWLLDEQQRRIAEDMYQTVSGLMRGQSAGELGKDAQDTGPQK